VWAEILDVCGDLQNHINENGGLEDAFGQFTPLSAWNGNKKEENCWRSVLVYVNMSYELTLIYEAFRAAFEEQEWAEEKESCRERSNIWLFQGDRLTIRIDRKRKADH